MRGPPALRSKCRSTCSLACRTELQYIVYLTASQASFHPLALYIHLDMLHAASEQPCPPQLLLLDLVSIQEYSRTLCADQSKGQKSNRHIMTKEPSIRRSRDRNACKEGAGDGRIWGTEKKTGLRKIYVYADQSELQHAPRLGDMHHLRQNQHQLHSRLNAKRSVACAVLQLQEVTQYSMHPRSVKDNSCLVEQLAWCTCSGVSGSLWPCAPACTVKA